VVSDLERFVLAGSGGLVVPRIDRQLGDERGARGVDPQPVSSHEGRHGADAVDYVVAALYAAG